MILLNGNRIDGTVGDALPIGSLSPFVGLVAPKGYLICMGQLVDKAKYPELWELCGDTFGQSTTTQFYLPDLRGVTIAGYKQGDSMFGTLGALIGSITSTTQNHTLTANEIPTHSHGISAVSNNHIFSGTSTWDTGANNRTYKQSSMTYGGAPDHNGTSLLTAYEYSGTNGGYWVADTGGGGAHNHGDVSTIQPTAVMNWIIKASMLAVVTGNIEDSLTSTSSTDALSAKQGKVLSESKINISDIVDNCTTNDASKVLSAKQGKALNDKFGSYIIKGEVIYSNDSGSNGNITFTKTISNATYPLMKIFYRNNDNMLESKEIYNPVGYKVNLSTNDARSGGANSGRTYIKTSCYDIGSTGMTASTGTFNYGNCSIGSDGVINMDGAARILYITKVVVYKTV